MGRTFVYSKWLKNECSLPRKASSSHEKRQIHLNVVLLLCIRWLCSMSLSETLLMATQSSNQTNKRPSISVLHFCVTLWCRSIEMSFPLVCCLLLIKLRLVQINSKWNNENEKWTWNLCTFAPLISSRMIPKSLASALWLRCWRLWLLQASEHQSVFSHEPLGRTNVSFKVIPCLVFFVRTRDGAEADVVNSFTMQILSQFAAHKFHRLL